MIVARKKRRAREKAKDCRERARRFRLGLLGENDKKLGQPELHVEERKDQRTRGLTCVRSLEDPIEIREREDLGEQIPSKDEKEKARRVRFSFVYFGEMVEKKIKLTPRSQS